MALTAQFSQARGAGMLGGGLLVASTWVSAAIAQGAPSLGPSPAPMPVGVAAGVAPGVAPRSTTATGAVAPTAPARPLEAREVIVPIPGAERMRIDNPLGNVTVRAWDRSDSVHIIAEKQSSSPEALARLRVHFTAWAGGEISVETRVEMGGRERALPLAASRVDLVIEVPPQLEIEAKTFAGDLSATGLRSGARLETTAGRIAVSDIRGRVVTHQLRGGQTVAAVDGDVDLDGVEGHMRLERLVGARVAARVVDGDIHAENIRSDEVRLSTTTGTVVLLGVLRPRAHYDLRSYSGEVRLEVRPGPPGGRAQFELHARSPVPIASTLPMRVLWRHGNRARAIVTATAARSGPTSATRTGTAGGAEGAGAGNDEDRPVVELNSVLGRVVLTLAQVTERTRVDVPLP